MTKQEKLKAILERLKINDIEGTHISVMVIVKYLNDFEKFGLIENEWKMTSTGEKISMICEEFDWKPEDNEIEDFVKELIDERDRIPFIYMLKKYRDNREEFLKEFKIQNDL